MSNTIANDLRHVGVVQTIAAPIVAAYLGKAVVPLLPAGVEVGPAERYWAAGMAAVLVAVLSKGKRPRAWVIAMAGLTLLPEVFRLLSGLAGGGPITEALANPVVGFYRKISIVLVGALIGLIAWMVTGLFERRRQRTGG